MRRLLGSAEGLLSQAGAAFLVKSSGALLALLLQVLLARAMGVSEFGVYILVFNWVMVLATFANLGLHLPIIRFVSSYRVERRFGALRGMLRRCAQLVLASSALLTLLYLAVVAGLTDTLEPSLAATLWVGAAALPLMALTHTGKSFMFAFRRSAAGMAPDLVLRPLLVAAAVGVVLVLTGTVSAPLAMVLMVAGGGAALLSTWWLVGRSRPAECRREAAEFESALWLRTALPFLLVAAAELLLARTDILVLGMLRPTAEVGIYASANLLAAALSMVTTSIEGVVAPRFAEQFARDDRGAAQRLLTRMVWGLSAVMLPAALLMLLFGEWVLTIFGRDFSAGGSVLAILVVGQLVTAAVGPVGMLLGIGGQQKRFALYMGMAGGLNLILAFSLIPALGAEGAAWARLATLLFYTSILGYLVWRRLGVMPSVAAPWLLWLIARGGRRG